MEGGREEDHFDDNHNLWPGWGPDSESMSLGSLWRWKCLTWRSAAEGSFRRGIKC